jgi:hypothetical protein
MLNRFIRRMREPVLDGNMIPRPPEYHRDLAALVAYPYAADECARLCEHTHAGLEGCWFTTADYSNQQEEHGALKGDIPSPQLARLLDIRWSGESVTFSRAENPRVIVGDFEWDEHDACLARFERICEALREENLHIVWRFYGWKWIYGGSVEQSPQREYWGLYTLNKRNKPECVSGATWIAQDRIVEQLPWP